MPRSIEALVPQGVHKTVCVPEANKLKPSNSYDAQFSLQWLTACAFVHGRFGLPELEPEQIADPVVMALTQKVTFGDYVDSPFPKAYSGAVTVTMDDGTEFKAIRVYGGGGAGVQTYYGSRRSCLPTPS